MRKYDGLQATLFAYEGPNLLSEQTAGVIRDYFYLHGEPVALVTVSQVYFIHGDHLGRPAVVTDAAQAVAWTSENNAFGNNPGTDLIGGLNLGFPGQYYDAESGTYYNYFRTFDALTGRYLPSRVSRGFQGSGQRISLMWRLFLPKLARFCPIN